MEEGIQWQEAVMAWTKCGQYWQWLQADSSSFVHGGQREDEVKEVRAVRQVPATAPVLR